MKPDAGILDRNLELLLRRAYVPVLARPDFRERVRSIWLEEFERRHGKPAVAPPRPVLRLPVPGAWVRSGLVAAAAVILVLLGVRLAGGSPPEDVETILARGEAAVRTDDGWESLEPHASYGQDTLELRTAGQAVELVFHGATLEVDPRTNLILHASVDGVRADLQAGGFATRAPRADEILRLECREGGVRFTGAEFRVALDATALHLILHGGRGQVGPREIPATTPARLVAGILILPEPGLTLADTDDTRRTLDATGATPSVATDATEEPSGGRIHGMLRSSDGSPALAFRLGILREKVGPAFDWALFRDFEAADGRFEWDGIKPGSYEVFAKSKASALELLGTIVIEHDGQEFAFDVTLRAGCEARGFVVDARTGDPIPGAAIVSERDTASHGIPFHVDSMPADSLWTPALARTRSDGSFRLKHLTSGRHILKVDAPGYAPAWIRDVDVTPDRPVTELEARLSVGGSLTGVVYDDSGNPRTGAQIVSSLMDAGQQQEMGFAIATTDGLGRYRLEHLPAGMLLAILVGPHEPRVRPVTIRTGATTTQDFGNEPDGALLHGTITHPDGDPLAARNLALFKAGAGWPSDWVATTTGTDGRYAFEDVMPGRYHLFVVESMGRTIQYLAELQVAGLTGEVRDLLMPQGRLHGTAEDALTGRPVPAAIVLLERRDEILNRRVFAGVMPVAPDGTWAFEHMPHGRYTCTVYPSGEQPGDALLGFERSEEVELGAQQPEVELPIGLYPGGTARIVVRTPAGDPVPGASIVLVDEDGFDYAPDDNPITDDNGHFRISGVRTGRFVVTVSKPGHHTARAKYECRAGLETVITVSLEPATRDSSETETSER